MKKNFRFSRWLALLLLATLLLPHLPARADDHLEELDAYLQQHMQDTPIPGLAVAVVRGDQVIFAKGYGVEVLGQPAPMTENSASAIGSLTKSFTAMAILQLVEQGKVELDAPVTRYIPWFRTADEVQSQKITVRMLLNNTGLPSMDYWVFIPDQDENAAIAAEVRMLSKVHLTREPGTSFEYSNDGWVVLGLIISTVSGERYSQYIQNHILTPLQMTRSSTEVAQFAALGALYGHYKDLESNVPAEPFTALAGLPAGSELRSTAIDLTHYAIALLNGGVYQGQSVLTPASIEALWTPGINVAGFGPEMGGTGADDYYAMGWVVSEGDGQHALVYHGGDTGRMSSILLLRPQDQLAVMLLVNTGSAFDPFRFVGGQTLAMRVLNIVQGEPLSPYGIPTFPDPNLQEPFITLPPEKLAAYVGTYIAEDGSTRAVYLNGAGQLELYVDMTALMHFRMRLEPLDESRFMAVDSRSTFPVFFQRTPAGVVESLTYAGALARKQAGSPLATRAVAAPDASLSFNLVEGWEVQWQPTAAVAFIATEVAVPARTLTGLSVTTPVLSAILKTVAPEAQVTYTGDEFTENWLGTRWREQAFATAEEVFLVLYAEGHDFALVLRTPPGALTATTQQVVTPILGSWAGR